MTERRGTALVTGARRGIGRGIALALAGAGFDIVINDLVADADAEKTASDVTALGRQAAVIVGDIAHVRAQDELVAAAWERFGGIDCLVNNAGVSVLSRGDLLDVTVESYDRCLDTNLRGTFFLTQRIARRMLAEPAAPGRRSIVTISSISAEVASVSRGEYCMSKAGLAMLSRLFAVRLAEAGIAVYEVRPGIIRTDMTKPSAETLDRLIASGISPIHRWGEPEDVGRAVATLAAGGLPFSVGQVVMVDGGLTLRTL
jgi:NAD(P)-dependent dehydrogenase (short-subunit alcohol dehydrogenase family)